MQVFGSGTMDRAGLQAQMAVFRGARVILGPHGAGLTNMLLARNASVIEFPLDPHVDRNMGYMAAALGLDYWLVPEVAAFYYQPYVMDEHRAAAVTRVLHHVLVRSGLGDLVRLRDEL